MSVGMVVYWGFMCVVPTLAYILYVINADKIDLNDVITPLPSLLLITIYNNDNKIILTSNVITQIIIYTTSLTLIAVWVLLETCSLVYICFELDYLSGIIKNMDNIIDKLDIKNENNSYENLSEMETKLSDLQLRHFVMNVHQHHLIIIQKVKDVYNSLKFSLLVYNQLACFHFSVVLYCMFQNNEISGKGKYVMAYLTTVGCYGMSCIMGQFLVNTSENLWNAIASNPWQNKPSWFKHCIKMLLIGTQKPLKMEPAGLYVLDLNFLLKVLQVSYSYCNLMLQFNSKKR
ncbi:uncharacterized protein LOC142333209 [Lycorma delicatula]|uniref:uncharacterized protein LOC142333209 n=1 Tax=Lycorma delicatula TaxID=130591 RepID=UPI003F511D76